MDRAEYAKMARLEDDHWWYRALHSRVIEAIADHAGGFRSLLDAGCGTGGLLRKLRALHPSAELVGLDLSAYAIERCRSRGLPFVCRGSLDEICFRPETFEVVTAQDVLSDERVDPGQALAELHRVLRPGGVLILNVPAFELLRSPHDRLVSTGHRFTRPEVIAWLERSGFAVATASYWNALLFPVVAGVRITRRLWGSAESDVRPTWPGLNRLLYMLVATERSRLATFRLPFGTSVFGVARKR